MLKVMSLFIYTFVCVFTSVFFFFINCGVLKPWRETIGRLSQALFSFNSHPRVLIS
ncbi:unnamed protein product [Brassica oleracea]